MELEEKIGTLITGEVAQNIDGKEKQDDTKNGESAGADMLCPAWGCAVYATQEDSLSTLSLVGRIEAWGRRL